MKFLGLNISRCNNNAQCKITLSKNYILQTFIIYDKYMKNKSKFMRSIIMGRVEFIKQNTPTTYEKFLKKFQNKYNIDYLELEDFKTKKQKKETDNLTNFDNLPF